jgi:hypothetical protein
LRYGNSRMEKPQSRLIQRLAWTEPPYRHCLREF